MPAKSRATGRRRRRIESLSSESLRVKVYAGTDPITSKRYDLTDTIPPGPTAAKDAQKALTRLIGQLDEKRNPGLRPRSASSWTGTSR
jgi:hypothetical protein